MFVKLLCKIVLLVSVCVVSADRDVGVNKSVDVGIQSDVKNFTDNVFHEKGQCISDADCHNVGKCETWDTDKFCNCKKGTSGDFCETVNECVDNPERCGTRDDVSCVFNAVKEKADCKCDNDSKTYVPYEGKCMSPCKENDQCSHGFCNHVVDRQRFCKCSQGTRGDYCEIIDRCKNMDCGVDTNTTCSLGTWRGVYCKCEDSPRLRFDYDEKVCKDCDCGPYENDCEIQNCTKICRCLYGSAQIGEVCEICNCGVGTSCMLKDGEKVCGPCEEGYLKAGQDGICTSCYCGIHGTKCEIIDGKKVCTCKKDYSQSGQDGICTKCDCGPFQRSCNFVNGQKKCDCMDSYEEDSEGECSLCLCKGANDGCHFVSNYGYYEKMVCKCLKGYVQYVDECIECDCGDHGKCSPNPLTTPIPGGYSKSCTCDEGYVESEGKCVECNCGKNGTCVFENRKKVCNCDENNKEYYGTCKACDCGYNAECKFNKYGEKECVCHSGYGMNNGVCKACNCYPGTSCTFGRYYSEKVCICPENYANDRGSCSACNCYPGTSCTFGRNGSEKVCICPKNFANDRGSCLDIDECLKSDACPSTTKCVNTPGSYDCVCKEGYENPSIPDIKKVGCFDIDECLSDWSCYDPYARCVNTPGSYRCYCQEGFLVSKGSYEKSNSCIQDSDDRSWRTVTILVGCLSVVLIVGLWIVICHIQGKLVNDEFSLYNTPQKVAEKQNPGILYF